MSSLTRADYSQHLVGKVIRRVKWTNDRREHYYALNLFFADDTLLTLRFDLAIVERAELSDFKDGDISNERELIGIPIRVPVKPLGDQ